MRTHFADDETLAHIAKLERDNKGLRKALKSAEVYLAARITGSGGHGERVLLPQIRAVLDYTKD